ncbi:hypothetical protein PDESU_00402 [Pontiella desulfatans]|uniref:C-type lectin domain-containing protein n=1 Tax=Pontiella desulfatans TaxID=2750659 RepID=A0A6C2TW09_PONDE|nr:lectin-like protein [Pontiella desulfatans]VGO11855.1 hypothetical protein PDESU_00402 [Pontiella desulfatans]
MKTMTVIFSCIVGFVQIASAAPPAEWPLTSEGNGHFYEVVYVPDSISWTDASNAAVNAGGYLATITSGAENNFVHNLIGNSIYWDGPCGPWIGGFQTAGSPEPSGGWQWVTGEPFVYSNWNSGQPNEFNNNNENCIHFGWNPETPYWNDVPDRRNVFASRYVQSYIIEYDDNPSPIHYVDIDNPTPLPPYTTWSTAANEIQSAVNEASNGDMVLVNSGHYVISSTLDLLKSLNVQSVNGPEDTIIDAQHQCRAVRMSSNQGILQLSGFTITGGNSTPPFSRGGAIHAYGNSIITVTNCYIQNNSSPGSGGGIGIFAGSGKAISATVTGCIITENDAVVRGGGIQVKIDGSGDIKISNCIVENNQAERFGGGIDIWFIPGAEGAAFVESCNIYSNLSLHHGGGIAVHAADAVAGVSRSLIQNNTAVRGGGVRLGKNSMLSDSLVSGNKTTQFAGGGISGSDSAISTVLNCTIVNNQAQTYGGGVNKAFIANSIVIDNKAPNQPDIANDCLPTYSCSPNLFATINGNINSNPQFVNPANDDYRLLMTSPCIDAGTNAFVYSAYDLDGLDRVRDGDLDGTPIVDMGAYELKASTITIYIKPGSDTNHINLKSKGRVPVAVITTEEVDAMGIDPATVRFAGASPVHTAYEDVDQDGDTDLLLHFLTQELQLSYTSTDAYLIGQTHDGQILMGVDTITVVPKKK